MKKNTIVALAIIICVVLAIGGKMYMDREKDKQELLTIQKDLANYLYTNYRLYTFDNEQEKELDEKYTSGNGDMTYRQYSDELNRIAKYSDIKEIKFTGFSVGPMKGLEVYFVINGVYEDVTTLDTKSAETDKWIYHINSLNEINSYYLEKKETSSKDLIPEGAIVYYEGGIK